MVFPFIVVLTSVVRALGAPNVWKITDFGINSEGTCKKLLITKYGRGSPNYRSPEVFLSDEDVPSFSNSVDVWGLGCILYELSVGKKAFPGPNSVLSYCSDFLGLPQVPVPPIEMLSGSCEIPTAIWNSIRSFPGLKTDLLRDSWVSQINAMLSEMLSKDPLKRPLTEEVECFCSANIIRSKLQADEVQI
jgi:serine/threonine protein kinase